MLQSELKIIEDKLSIQLPEFYVATMLNYTFNQDSFAYEFALCVDYKKIIDFNGIFEPKDSSFAIGSDGGEYIYYIKLNGEGKVYIFDLEGSNIHNSLEAKSWEEYLYKLKKDEEDTSKGLEEEEK